MQLFSPTIISTREGSLAHKEFESSSVPRVKKFDSWKVRVRNSQIILLGKTKVKELPKEQIILLGKTNSQELPKEQLS